MKFRVSKDFKSKIILVHCKVIYILKKSWPVFLSIDHCKIDWDRLILFMPHNKFFVPRFSIEFSESGCKQKFYFLTTYRYTLSLILNTHILRHVIKIEKLRYNTNWKVNK
ncbi:hypothetical protein BpHYR1_042553 [Brachionus plicatilis]|uniref:Uncharacterized protein n=1 Tax=Brachionus plicatilis TaxID=10195 RepID=A0A3M7RXH6_BRAPC|nr:hypothetical protein BpHYR1_042553 [Brachionus plicatilis]